MRVDRRPSVELTELIYQPCEPRSPLKNRFINGVPKDPLLSLSVSSLVSAAISSADDAPDIKLRSVAGDPTDLDEIDTTIID